MAIIENKETESNNVSGFNKSIEASAMSMMLDNLQIFMYQKPIQSTVRECTSNALDSLKEKKIALEIVTGQSQVSDYFVEKEGDIYKDSKFDHNYYDPKWLSSDNTVYLSYMNSTDSLSRDQFVIEDTGVGLGGLRLEKYFSLGYSSKRLTSQTLGAFGLGNKSPLATGVDSYRIVSRYNGREFSFDVFSHKVDCVYSKWDENGGKNKSITFSNGFEAFYKETKEKNGLKLIVDVKKHNKNQYIEAVKSQLMYFKDNIIFKEFYEGQSPRIIDFKSNIIFESDDIIVSDSNYFSRPHFVLKNVSYGAVDFKELELENRHGTIGIKINMEEVDVSPSRENIIYNQRSREVILKKYNNITNTVTEMINNSLKTEDMVEWIRACNNIFYGGIDRSNDVLYKLSGMIDKFSLNLSHPTKPDLKYHSDLEQFMTKGLKVEKLYAHQNYSSKRQKYVNSIKREEAGTCNEFNQPIFLQFNGGGTRTTKYLFSLHPRGFTVIRSNFKEKEITEVYKDFVYGTLTEEEAVTKAKLVIDEVVEEAAKAASYLLTFKKSLVQLADFKASIHVKIYDDSIVPEDFKVADGEDEDAVEIKEEKVAIVDYKQVLKDRKANGKFIVGRTTDRSTSYTEKFVFANEEVDNTAFGDDEEIVYGYTKDTDSLLFLARIAGKKYGTINASNYDQILGWTKELKVCKIAQNNKKYLVDKMHIDEYLIQYKDGVMTTSDLLKDYFTVKYIRENLINSPFLINFTIFDDTLASAYKKLFDKSQKSTTISLPGTESTQLLDKAIEYQLFKLTHPDADPDLLDKKGIELLGADILDEINDVEIIDEKVIETVEWINKFSETYSTMFNQISALRQAKNTISNDLERDIKSFIALRKDELELDYPTLNY